MFFHIIEKNKDGRSVLINQSKISHIAIGYSGEAARLFWGEGEDLRSCELSDSQLKILKQALDLCVLEPEPPQPLTYDGPQPF
ncbi:MAG: hypothetical protein ACRCT1_07490 [Microcoleaceae cyanobacterium]